MDEAEAHHILASELNKYRAWKREALVRLIDDRLDYPIKAPSGVTYNMDVQAVWDAEPNEDLRVMVAIDDGGPSVYVPMVDGFIVAPDGTFVGE
jgi:hypothetical protein